MIFACSVILRPDRASDTRATAGCDVDRLHLEAFEVDDRAFDSRWYQRGVEAGIEHTRERIRHDAYWFSEDAPTMNLLMEFGKGGGFDISHTRENWRKARAARQPQEPTA